MSIGHAERVSGTSMHEWSHSKLAMGALGEAEEPGTLVGDPRRGESGLLCTKTLRRAGKHNNFVCLFFIKKILLLSL